MDPRSTHCLSAKQGLIRGPWWGHPGGHSRRHPGRGPEQGGAIDKDRPPTPHPVSMETEIIALQGQEGFMEEVTPKLAFLKDQAETEEGQEQ